MTTPLFLGGALLCCAYRHPLRVARYLGNGLNVYRRSVDCPAVRSGLLLVLVALPVASTAGSVAAIGILSVFATQLRWRGGNRQTLLHLWQRLRQTAP